ncbi:MAG TPA: permease prefix domain 1-containing protein [Actinoplanes sp.]|jgi:hypothetical protein
MTTLIDRYVFTALRRVPEKQRADIDRELRAAIDDAVEARVAGGEPHQAATENALLELGDPERLADGYAGGPRYLIGPELFGIWRRLLVFLFSVVLPIVVVVAVVLKVLDDAAIGPIIGTAVSTVITTGAHLAFWSTAIFAVLERTGVARTDLRGGPWTLDHLPRYEPGSLTAGQLVPTVLWPVLLIVALILQQFTFSTVPALDPANWSFWWPFLIAVLLGECAYAVWVFRRATWTHAVTAINAVLAVLFAAPIIWLASTDRFFNPEFVAGIDWGSADPLSWLGGIVIAIAAVGAIWDIVEVAVRAERARRGIPAEAPGTVLRGCA